MHNSILMPHIDFDQARESEIDIFVHFTGHYRNTPQIEEQYKILNAIQYVAVLMDHSDEYISRQLVEMGLRAPRDAFPIDFLSYFDRVIERKGQHIGGPSDAMLELLDQWNGMSLPLYDIPAPRSASSDGKVHVA